MVFAIINDIGDNIINAEGAQAIAESLKVNSTLTWIGAFIKIGLDNNAIGDEGIKAISEAIKVNKSLTKLCIL